MFSSPNSQNKLWVWSVNSRVVYARSCDISETTISPDLFRGRLSGHSSGFMPRSEKAILHQRSSQMVRWKASDLGIPTAPATQGGAGLERNMHYHNTIVDSHLTSVLGGQFVTDFWGKYGPCQVTRSRACVPPSRSIPAAGIPRTSPACSLEQVQP